MKVNQNWENPDYIKRIKLFTSAILSHVWSWGKSISVLSNMHLSEVSTNSIFFPWKKVNKSSAAAAAKSLQSCPTLCDFIDSSPPGSPVPGILQARTLEWVPFPSPMQNAWKWKVQVKSLSRVRPSATPWTAAHQAPPSMGFCRQEYWSGVPLPSLWIQVKWAQKLYS